MLFLVVAKKLLDTHELRSLTFRRNWFCLGLKGLLLKKKKNPTRIWILGVKCNKNSPREFSSNFTVSSKRLLSALHNWFKLVYG